MLLRRKKEPMLVTGGLTLGKRTALLVVLALSLILSLFGFLGLRSLQESSNRAMQERLVAAQLTARHIDGFLSLYLDALTEAVASETMDFRDPSSPSVATVIDRLRHRRGAILDHHIVLVDDTGKVVWSDPPLPSSAAREYTIAADVMKSGRSAISNSFDDDAGRVLAALAVPIPGPNHSIAGALVEVLDLSDPILNGFVQPVSLGTTGYAEIVDSNGLVLASSSPSRLFRKSDHTDQFAAMIRSARPTVGGCHSCHEEGGGPIQPDILAFAPLTVAPWGVSIRQSEEEALGPARDLQRSFLVAGLISLVVAMGVVWLASRSVVWPIRSLTVASRRIADGDLEKEIDRQGPAEIGELAGAFDEMRVKLRASLEKLENVNTDLENRVEQRTRQLAALLDVSKAIASTLEVRCLLDAVAARTPHILDLADAGIIAFYDEGTERLHVEVSWGFGEAVLMMSLAPGEGATGRAFAEGRPLLLNTADALLARNSSLSPENWAWMAQADHHLGPLCSLIAVPLTVKGKVIGAMSMSHYGDSGLFTYADLHIAQALADQVAVAVENARLYQEVRESEKLRGELLDKVIAAQEDERKRIARELHDDTCQSLAALAIRLEDVEQNLPESATEARSELTRLKAQVTSTLQEVRAIAYNLRPSILDDLGLMMAIDWYVKEQLAKRGLEVRLDLEDVEGKLSPAIETVLFRLAQEALNNVVKHSGASSASVRLRVQGEKVVLEVEDDGLGFDVERALRARGARYTLGLHGMMERARISGGVLLVASTIGHGTRLRAELPIQTGRENGIEKDHSLVGGRSQTA